MNPDMRLSSSFSQLAPKKPLAARLLVQAAGVGVAVIIFALLGTGTSYALWNGRTETNASTVSAGNTSATINGAADYTITSLTNTKLGPGQSTLVPLTVANTGTTKISASFATTSTTANALTDELSIRVTASGTCSAGLAGGTIGRMATFTSAATPVLISAGQSATVCLEVVMDLDAPVSVANLGSDFTMTMTATQVRGA